MAATGGKKPRMKMNRLPFEYLGIKVLTISEDPYEYVGVDTVTGQWLTESSPDRKEVRKQLYRAGIAKRFPNTKPN